MLVLGPGVRWCRRCCGQEAGPVCHLACVARTRFELRVTRTNAAGPAAEFLSSLLGPFGGAFKTCTPWHDAAALP